MLTTSTAMQQLEKAMEVLKDLQQRGLSTIIALNFGSEHFEILIVPDAFKQLFPDSPPFQTKWYDHWVMSSDCYEIVSHESRPQVGR